MRAAAQGYWNHRRDPLDWKRRRPATGRAGWEAACRAFLAADTRDALDAMGDLRGLEVLDLGCGVGNGTAHLDALGGRVTALDLADERCRVARSHLGKGTALACGDAARLPFGDESFQRVFACDVLMYTEPRRVVAECARVLVPGGRAVFVEALAGNPALALYRRLSTSRDYRSFTRYLGWSELRRLGAPLQGAGARAHHLLTLPAWIALFALRAPRLHRFLLDALEPLDRRLLGALPALRHLAWRGVLVLEKPSGD